MGQVPQTMAGVQLTGYGGFEALAYRDDLPVPQPGPGEVLLQVLAAGVNNADINARVGWYAKSVTGDTASQAAGQQGQASSGGGMGDWTGDPDFPRIQGLDCLGRVVAVGAGVSDQLLDQRALVQPYLYDPGDPDWRESVGFLGSDRDGAFAQFMSVPLRNIYPLPATDLSDAQLATLPCSGGTAMNMLRIAGLKQGDSLLVTGASGGVGTFLIQIAKHFGARVVALADPSKAEALAALGADAVIDRRAQDWPRLAKAANQGRNFSLVADVVGGSGFEALLGLLARGGRYVVAGAIAGPLVALDLRTLYLKSLSFYGSAAYEPGTFEALLQVLAEGGLKPMVAGSYPLRDIQAAQEAFLAKTHVGSFVLIPSQSPPHE